MTLFTLNVANVPSPSKTVDVEGQPVNVYVTHLNERADAHGTATRTRQVADLLEFVATTSAQAPVVIAGDFNTAADALDLEALRKSYGDSYGSVHRNGDASVSTLNTHVFAKPARIDHVFFQQNRLLAREARILFDTPYAEGRWASDHYGVWVRLQLAEATIGAGDAARSIAFPAISTGVFGFPRPKASAIAVRECSAFLVQNPDFERITLVAFSASDAEILRGAALAARPE